MSSNGESGVYNVGVGKTISRKDQIQALIDIWSPKEHPSKIIVNRKKPDSPFFLMDISKTKEQLGYEPKYFYKEGMIDIKDEMERNRFKKLWGTEKDYTEDMKSE
jgi:UDP-glucose 4-epimerase